MSPRSRYTPRDARSRAGVAPAHIAFALAVAAFGGRCAAACYFSGLPPSEMNFASSMIIDFFILPLWVGALLTSIRGLRRGWAGPWCGIAITLVTLSPFVGSLINTVRTFTT